MILGYFSSNCKTNMRVTDTFGSTQSLRARFVLSWSKSAINSVTGKFFAILFVSGRPSRSVVTGNRGCARRAAFFR